MSLAFLLIAHSTAGLRFPLSRQSIFGWSLSLASALPPKCCTKLERMFPQVWPQSLVVMVFLGQSCRAQSDHEPAKVGSVTVQRDIRTRSAGWQWFRGHANSNYVFSGSLL